jgi:hypothetical protein
MRADCELNRDCLPINEQEGKDLVVASVANGEEEYLKGIQEMLKQQLKEHKTILSIEKGDLWIVPPDGTMHPKVFLWFPRIMIPNLRIPCPHCHGFNTSVHEWLKNPRQVAGLFENYYIVSRRYKCSDCECKRNGTPGSEQVPYSFMPYHAEVLKRLPKSIASKFPAVLSHRSGSDTRLIGLLQSLTSSGITASEFCKLVKEKEWRESHDEEVKIFNQLMMKCGSEVDEFVEMMNSKNAKGTSGLKEFRSLLVTNMNSFKRRSKLQPTEQIPIVISSGEDFEENSLAVDVREEEIILDCGCFEVSFRAVYFHHQLAMDLQTVVREEEVVLEGTYSEVVSRIAISPDQHVNLISTESDYITDLEAHCMYTKRKRKRETERRAKKRCLTGTAKLICGSIEHSTKECPYKDDPTKWVEPRRNKRMKVSH